MSDPGTAQARILTRANALTASRLVLLALLVPALLSRNWWLAAPLFALAVVTDIFDGKIARKYGETSALGGLFDHATDALFVTLCAWASAQLGLINPWLTWLIPAAFLQYMLDSKALAGLELKASALGRSNGVAYYALAGTVIGMEALGFTWLRPAVAFAAWVLVASTVLSMLDRARALVSARFGA